MIFLAVDSDGLELPQARTNPATATKTVASASFEVIATIPFLFIAISSSSPQLEATDPI